VIVTISTTTTTNALAKTKVINLDSKTGGVTVSGTSLLSLCFVSLEKKRRAAQAKNIVLTFLLAPPRHKSYNTFRLIFLQSVLIWPG
jgi:hypothetical protein